MTEGPDVPFEDAPPRISLPGQVRRALTDEWQTTFEIRQKLDPGYFRDRLPTSSIRHHLAVLVSEGFAEKRKIGVVTEWRKKEGGE